MGNELGSLSNNNGNDAGGPQLERQRTGKSLRSSTFSGPGHVSLKDLKQLLSSTTKAFESFTLEKKASCSVGMSSVAVEPRSSLATPDMFDGKQQQQQGIGIPDFLKPVEAQTVGDKCVTWQSTPADEPSFVEARVKAVRRDADSQKSIVLLDNGTEMDLETLTCRLNRAQNALAVETEWLAKLREANLFEGTAIDLWVPVSHDTSPRTTPPAIRRTRSQLQAESPRCRRPNGAAFDASLSASSSSTSASSSAACIEAKGPVSSVQDEQHGQAADDAAPQQPPARNLADEPGNLCTFTVRRVGIRWNYQDAELHLVAARRKPDGTHEADQMLCGPDVLAMVDAARPAREHLDRLLRRINVHDGIAPGAKIDLWLDDLHTRARGAVVRLGHRFVDGTPTGEVELLPFVKYYVDGEKHFRQFPDYASFISSWKRAKYVAEQQAMLAQHARAAGVVPGATVCVEQAPFSARWPFKKPGVLEAVVADLRFSYDPDTNEAGLKVLTQYRTQGLVTSSSARARSNSRQLTRRISLAPDDEHALEWVAWDELRRSIRSKVVVSSIHCDNLRSQQGLAAKPFIKFVLGASKRRTPPSFALDPRWDGLECLFREGEDGNRKTKLKKDKNQNQKKKKKKMEKQQQKQLERQRQRQRSASAPPPREYGYGYDSDDDDDGGGDIYGNTSSAAGSPLGSGGGGGGGGGAAGINPFFDQVLEVRVYSERKVGRRAFLGAAEIHLSHLLPSGRTVVTKPLAPVKGEKSPQGGVAGTMTVTLTAVGPGVVPAITDNVIAE